MRKIEQKMLEAIRNGRVFKSGNTIVTPVFGTCAMEVYLHNHCIAVIDRTDATKSKVIQLNSCGYRTRTTKSRLNALLGGLCFNAGIYQSKNQWYLQHVNGTVPFFDRITLTEGM